MRVKIFDCGAKTVDILEVSRCSAVHDVDDYTCAGHSFGPGLVIIPNLSEDEFVVAMSFKDADSFVSDLLDTGFADLTAYKTFNLQCMLTPGSSSGAKMITAFRDAVR